MTQEGLVLASDSRTNAGFDQVNTCRKMYRFVQPGERVFVILTSGGLSISQSVITLLGDDFDSGRGLAQANSLYDAARIVGDCVRRVSDLDRASLERDSFSFNVHLLLGGQVRGQEPNLYLIYPQGNPLAATEDSLYLQLGECKYGRPILDRGIQPTTSLEVAAKYALLSLDATMRSNVTVGPPFAGRWSSYRTSNSSLQATKTSPRAPHKPRNQEDRIPPGARGFFDDAHRFSESSIRV